MKRIGKVFVSDVYAGVIQQDEDGFTFNYDIEYLNSEMNNPVSLTLPLKEVPYKSKILFPFFDGLIPEGWLLEITEKNWKIDKRDRMGLLLNVCNDCIGNVSVKQEKDTIDE